MSDGTTEKNAQRGRLEEAAWVLAMLLPGALIVFLGFRSGGFYPGATSLAAAEMALVLGLRFVLAKRPLQGVSAPLIVAVVAIGLLAGWTLLSANWSDSVARALPAYSRVLLFALLLLFFGTLPFKPNRIRWMLYGVVAAAVVICGAALTARLLPNVILDTTLVKEHRLGYPLTYWNALGILACVGTVLSAHVACSTRDAPLARVLAAACVPLLGLTLYYTLSRGGIWAAPAALVVYAVVGRPRALLSGAIAMIPASAIVLLTASPSSSVTEHYPLGMVDTGHHIVWVLVGCMLGAALLRATLLPLDSWLEQVHLPDSARRPVLIGATVLALGLVLAVGAAANVPHVVNTKYHEFTDRHNTSPGGRDEKEESRLLSARPEGRFELWDVALDSYREDRLHGSGAGTYVVQWDKMRTTPKDVRNAHSLYMETLGELGLVGLILLVVAIGLILGAFAYRARGPDRALFAALLAAGLAWAVHAGVDWDWQMPAVDIWFFALGGATLARSLVWKRRRRQKEWRRSAVRAVGAIACLFLAIIPAQVAVSQARLDSAIGKLQRGECDAAVAEANSSLSAVSQRPAPYTVIAFCDMKRRRFGSATIAMDRAIDRDPANWELYYYLAVARAGAGLDPSKAAKRAAKLNPYEELASSAPHRFRGKNRQGWEQAALRAPLLPPAPGDP